MVARRRERTFGRILAPPKEGSRRRRLYDLLLATPNVAMSLTWTDLGYPNAQTMTQDIAYLRDHYGMSITTNNGTVICHQ